MRDVMGVAPVRYPRGAIKGGQLARKQRTGMELDLHVMSECHKLLSQLDDEAIEPTLEWLVKRIRADQLSKAAETPGLAPGVSYNPNA